MIARAFERIMPIVVGDAAAYPSPRQAGAQIHEVQR
jgi:hypothetical protein